MKGIIWYFLFSVITLLCIINISKVNGENKKNVQQSNIERGKKKSVTVEKEKTASNTKKTAKGNSTPKTKQQTDGKKEKKKEKKSLGSLSEKSKGEQKIKLQNVELSDTDEPRNLIAEEKNVPHKKNTETIEDMEEENRNEYRHKEQEQAFADDKVIREEVDTKKEQKKEITHTRSNANEELKEYNDEIEFQHKKEADNSEDNDDEDDDDDEDSIYNTIRNLKSKNLEKHMKPDVEDFHYDNESDIEDITTLWNKSMQNFEPSTLLTFEIGSHSEEYLFEDVDKIDTYFRGVFYSYNDSEDNIIQLSIRDPDGNVIYKKEASEGIFLFHTKKIGVYTFALRNTKWVGKKVIAVAIGIGENLSLQSDHVKDFTNYLYQIIAETIKLNNEIKYLTSKHHVHIDKMKKIANKALIYHIVKLFVLIFLSLFTIYYIKNLVQNKRVL